MGDEVYKKLGWKKTVSGRVIPPDPHKRVAGRRKSRGERKSTSKQQSKFEIAASERMLRSSAPSLLAESVHEMPQMAQPAAESSCHTRKSRTAKFKEKVALAVYNELEQQCAFAVSRKCA